MTDNTLQELAAAGVCVKHYCDDLGACIKWDGGSINVDGDRYDAEELVKAITKAARTTAPSVTKEELATLLEKAYFSFGFKDEPTTWHQQAQSILTQFNVTKKEG